MSLKRVVAIALFFIFGCFAAYAQTDNSKANNGSVYSKIGIGFPIEGGSSGAGAMGLSGVSYIEPYVPGYANPAHWGFTQYGMATGGVSLQGFSSADNQGSATNLLFAPDFFQAQLPLVRGKLGISASLAPLSRSSYSQVELGSKFIGSGATQDTLVYQTQTQGSGGVNRLELGAGWRINRFVSVGYAASFVFASINNEHSTIFDNPEYNRVSYNRQTSGTGFGNRFGLQLNLPSVLGKNDRLSVGASASLPINLDAERIEEATKPVVSGGSQTVVTRDGESLGKGAVELPVSFNAGITYQPSPLLAVSSEGLYEQWSDFRYDFSAEEESWTTDRYKIGLGLNYFPYISGSNKFLSNFKYRLGASYDTGHLQINGQRVETLMFSFGLGILSPKSNSSVDISFEYGIRGTKAQDLVKEDIWGLRLSLNLAEIMFFRPKLK